MLAGFSAPPFFMNALNFGSGQNSAFPGRVKNGVLMSLPEIPGIRVVGRIADRLDGAILAKLLALARFMLFQ